MILLVSLRHTGAHFLKAFLQQYATEAMPIGNVGLQPIPDGALIWGHYDAAHFKTIVLLSKDVRPIVPMRDPLAVLISHKTRGERFDIDLWLHAAENMDSYNPVYFPVDLPRDRFDAVVKTCLQQDHHLNAAYRKGDVGWLEANMPTEWDALRTKGQALKPWLERMGYEKWLW